MKIIESLKPREHVDDFLKWDLTDLFADDEAFNRAKAHLDKQAEIFIATYKNQLTDVDTIIKALETYEENKKLSDWLSIYVTLLQDTDLTQTENLEKARQTASFLAKTASKVSFFKAEILANDIETIKAIADKKPKYEAYVRQLLQEYDTRLNSETEQTIASYQTVFKHPIEMFEQIRSNDLDFDTFVVDGVEYPLSFVLYEEYYMYHPDKDIRRAAYKQFSKTLSGYQNVMASIYYEQVAEEKITSELRGYDSVFDYLLVDQEVTREMYDRQLDVITDKFAPIIRRYLKHLKKENDLDTLYYADLKIDFDASVDKKVDISETKDLIYDALQPMGNKYRDTVMQAFSERWIDFSRNKGKRTGASSTTAYGNHPYIIMSWANRLDSAYTLIHELGHGGQALYSNAEQPLSASRPSLYLIEASSTFNELLLTRLLYKEYKNDKRGERMVLSTLISKTYFHNFVTHLIEGLYQREVYRLIDDGKSFTASTLNQIMYDVNKTFFGDAVELEDGVELTWMRQRHYYRGLYPYTYSAGLTISTNVFLQAVDGQEETINNWLEFISLGGSKTPIEAANIVGVDITTDEPLLNTIDFLGKVVDKIIDLGHEL